MPSVSEIKGLLAAVVTRLAEGDDYSGTEVLGNKPGDMVNQVQTQLAACGIYTLVSIPRGQSANRQSSRPILDPLDVYVLIREDPELNKTGKDATFLAERGFARLQWWTPPKDTVPGGYMLTLAPAGMQELDFRVKQHADDPDDSAIKIHSWELLFHTKLALTPAT